MEPVIAKALGHKAIPGSVTASGEFPLRLIPFLNQTAFDNFALMCVYTIYGSSSWHF